MSIVFVVDMQLVPTGANVNRTLISIGGRALCTLGGGRERLKQEREAEEKEAQRAAVKKLLENKVANFVDDVYSAPS